MRGGEDLWVMLQVLVVVVLVGWIQPDVRWRGLVGHAVGASCARGLDLA